MIMKEKLSLMKLNEMSTKETYSIKGGQSVTCCTCACAWANCGGSSTSDNGGANAVEGLHSHGMGSACR
jgi:hypothetical protein